MLFVAHRRAGLGSTSDIFSACLTNLLPCSRQFSLSTRPVCPWARHGCPLLSRDGGVNKGVVTPSLGSTSLALNAC